MFVSILVAVRRKRLGLLCTSSLMQRLQWIITDVISLYMVSGDRCLPSSDHLTRLDRLDWLINATFTPAQFHLPMRF